MNKFPLIEMLAYFSRHSRPSVPQWRDTFVQNQKRILTSCTKEEGGIKKSYYSIETKEGEIIDLIFNHEELIWDLEASGKLKGYTVDKVLVHMKRHKNPTSASHRVVPLRFEVLPRSEVERKSPIEFSLIERMQPYRFQKNSNGSIQVQRVVARNNENRIHEVNLNYVVEDTDKRFYHLIFITKDLDWRFIKEMDRLLFED
ncbi:MAG: hypothetical protein CL670_12480 [Balneola sp.]|jgi:hypothetical protein|nr:hypothetical protein [Balneola sp.]MBE79963.1 hypothetical protein [Balneola sp.]|tara:strand:+ start:5377 stop:5979 length:603 start_codon:yes stop_codon:yes gene_type:complete